MDAAMSAMLVVAFVLPSRSLARIFSISATRQGAHVRETFPP